MASLRRLAAQRGYAGEPWMHMRAGADAHAAPAGEPWQVPLTNIMADGLVRTLTKHAVEHAISLVDVMVPGLPLLFVNDAWERLTGY